MIIRTMSILVRLAHVVQSALILHWFLCVASGKSRNMLADAVQGSSQESSNTVAFAKLPEGFASDVDEISVSCGHAHTCSLEASPATPIGGVARCWGMNTAGQLEVENLEGFFIQISAGLMHNCAVRVDEAVQCWGEPNLSYSPQGLFLQVSCGSFHTCGIRKDYEIQCWGKNYNGQSDAPSGPFVQLSSGGDHSCALRQDGTVSCWGSNKKGQCNAPRDKQFVQVVASFTGHSCALGLDGTVTCWGNNDQGQCNAPSTTFSQISAGYAVTCGIRNHDRKLECWGGGSRIVAYLPQDKAFDEISLGEDHACGITAGDNDLYCWGHDYHGGTIIPDYFTVA